jgi:hypothetical protein
LCLSMQRVRKHRVRIFPITSEAQALQPSPKVCLGQGVGVYSKRSIPESAQDRGQQRYYEIRSCHALLPFLLFLPC